MVQRAAAYRAIRRIRREKHCLKSSICDIFIPREVLPGVHTYATHCKVYVTTDNVYRYSRQVQLEVGLLTKHISFIIDKLPIVSYYYAKWQTKGVFFMLSEETIVKALGGRSSLGRQVKSSLDLDELIRIGFPYKAGIFLKDLLNLDTNQFTKYLQLSERTWIRVRNTHKRLSSVVSDRIYRLARIYSLACEVLEDDVLAKEWLNRPQYGLGGKIPLELLHTEAGTKEVEDLLWRIEYGIAA